MAFYTVSYDLNKKKDYAKFEEGIRKVSNNIYVKATLSQYIIQSSLSAPNVLTTLRGYTDTDDSIVILKLDIKDWAYINLPDKVKSWLDAATKVGN